MQVERGRFPTELTSPSQGFLNDRLVAAHCRCMTAQDDELLGLAGVNVAFDSAIAARRCLSHEDLRTRRRRCTYRVLGPTMMAEDMVEVMRTGLFMERVRIADGRNSRSEDALRWATVNGYRAL